MAINRRAAINADTKNKQDTGVHACLCVCVCVCVYDSINSATIKKARKRERHTVSVIDLYY